VAAWAVTGNANAPAPTAQRMVAKETNVEKAFLIIIILVDLPLWTVVTVRMLDYILLGM
jgi:hypothetical protein